MVEDVGRRFPRSRRLLAKSRFDQVFRKGRRSGAEGLSVIVYRGDDGHGPRLGVSISRKFGKAVARNRARRLLREAFRHLAADLDPTLDVIVLPRAGQFPDRRAEVEAQLGAAIQRALRPRRQGPAIARQPTS